MRIDYRSFLNKIWEALPADDYVAMASGPHVLGDPLLKTQHFIGASKWEKTADDEVVGWHQLRVPHQRYTDASKTEVAVKGHAHGTNQHWYRKIDGVWKFAGLAPEIKWGEFDFDKVFESGRETFGEEEKVREEVAITNGVPVEGGPGMLGGEEVKPALGEIGKIEGSDMDAQAVQTASGIESTIEKLPVEVAATMMQKVPENYNSLSMEGVVGA
jgi:scytalone dehydratase